jgi:hypothetical protein
MSPAPRTPLGMNVHQRRIHTRLRRLRPPGPTAARGDTRRIGTAPYGQLSLGTTTTCTAPLAFPQASGAPSFLGTRRGRGSPSISRDGEALGALIERRGQNVIVYVLPDGEESDRALDAIGADYDSDPPGFERRWSREGRWTSDDESLTAVVGSVGVVGGARKDRRR